MKKNVLILAGTRVRSPMSIQTYRYMARTPGLPFNTYLCHDIPGGTSFEGWIKRFMNGTIPDAIVGGMGCDFGSFYSDPNHKFMDEHGIKKVFQVGDLTQTLEMGPAVAAHAMSDWDVIWNVSTGNQKVDANQRIEEFVSTWTHLRKTKVVYHPWSFDPKYYFDDTRKRDVDVFYSMTIDSNWFSQNRAKMFNALNPLRSKYHIMSGAGDQQGNWHGIYGWPYEEGLRKSKICMVDTAHRNNMTAKYLEGAASGCLLMGDAPWGMDEVFNDDTMAIVDYNNIDKDLPKQVDFYLSNPDELSKKAKKLQAIVNKDFTNEASVPILEDKLLNALAW